MVGLWLMATRVAMYRARRTSARPPRIRRYPVRVPLSSANGATPTSLLICRWLSAPSSGSEARSRAEVAGPMPGTDCSNWSRARQMGLASIAVRRSVGFRQLFLKPSDMREQILAHRPASQRQAIALGDEQLHELPAAGDQGL